MENRVESLHKQIVTQDALIRDYYLMKAKLTKAEAIIADLQN